MTRILSVMIFLFTFTGCTPPPIVEGEVISSRELGQGFSEHLVRTSSALIPYYVLRTNKNNFQKGAKVVLEIRENSMTHVIH